MGVFQCMYPYKPVCSAGNQEGRPTDSLHIRCCIHRLRYIDWCCSSGRLAGLCCAHCCSCGVRNNCVRMSDGKMSICCVSSSCALRVRCRGSQSGHHGNCVMFRARGPVVFCVRRACGRQSGHRLHPEYHQSGLHPQNSRNQSCSGGALPWHSGFRRYIAGSYPRNQIHGDYRHPAYRRDIQR